MVTKSEFVIIFFKVHKVKWEHISSMLLQLEYIKEHVVNQDNTIYLPRRYN